MLRELAQSVLLGTERGTPVQPGSRGPLGEVLEQISADTVEKQVLLQAAILSVYEEAAWEPRDLTETGIPEPCPEDDLELCSSGSAYALQQILQDHIDVLPEWLQLARTAHVRVPPELLPALLAAGERRTPLHVAIRSVIGCRGIWLAAQNTSWAYAASEESGGDRQNVWEEGKQTERVSYLRHFRTKDPAAARTQIEEACGQESAAVRAEFVSTMDVSLSMDDEPFLEGCLDDRSKQVQQQAAALLAQLPESRFAARMTERLLPLIAQERHLFRKTITVSTPDEFAEAALRDALAEKSGRSGRLGKAAWRLMQIVAATPLGFWKRELGMTVQQTLELALKSEWSEALLTGLAKAAVTQQSADWAVGLLSTDLSKTQVDTDTLLCVLLAAAREKFFLDRLSGGKAERRGVLNDILSRTEGIWGEALSQAVLDQYRALVPNIYSSGDWHLRSLMPRIAEKLAPGVLPHAEEGWPDKGDHWNAFTEQAAVFTEVVRLRRLMHKELAP